MSVAADRAPFERLARMIEEELELIAAGRIDEFRAAVASRGEYVLTLPAPAPEAARPVVARVRALHSRVEIEALRVREQLALERARHAGARRAAKGYAGIAPQLVSTSV